MDVSPTFFEDIKQYIGFSDRDSSLLQTLRPRLEPHFERIADHFYERILAHPKAHAAITGGDEQVARLKRTLVEWMRSGLAGPHDETFYERRSRIGRIHLQIALPQQYMVTAMNVMRLDYRGVLRDVLEARDPFIEACNAVDCLFDLELAIMFQTYQADFAERLRRRERLATIGQLAASIGHDLRNPLGVIESSLFILGRRPQDDPRVTKHLDRIAKQVQTCGRIVNDLLDMARNQPPRLQSVSLAKLVADVAEQVPVPASVSVAFDVPAHPHVVLDPGLTQQALVNVLSNAVRALQPAGGRIQVWARIDDDCVEITVVDDGPGFDPSIMPLAFEPLVTTRAKGIGLGLALVKSIIERHGGHVRGSNVATGGARIDIVLPVLSLPAEP